MEKKGAWLQFQGELIGQGKEAARKTLTDKPELFKKVVDAVVAHRLAAALAAEAAHAPKIAPAAAPAGK